MFTTFSSAPLSPPAADVLQEVQDILDRRGITFGTLVADALRDTGTSLGATVISDLADILEALRPHLEEDEKARTLLGKFFASVASSELLRIEKGDDHASWKLPATKLSTEQLMEFSLEELGKKIGLDAPALWSFLDGACGGGRTSDRETGEDDAEDDAEDNVEDESEFGTEAKRKVSPARLLEIVSSLACPTFVAHIANHEQRKITIASIILNTRNQKCNAFQVAIGVFLHSTHTPDRVINALHRAGICISSTSISRAIKSMSAQTIELLATLGGTLLLLYAYDNFDIQGKPSTPTLENNVDPLRHLTSALVFPFQHGVVPEDLQVSQALWEADGFNDESELATTHTRSDMWSKILPRYSELLVEGAEELDRHHEFRVWLFLRDLIEHGPTYFQKFRNELSLPTPIEEPIPVAKTHIIPLQSMDISNSTVTGNIDTILKLLEQTGLGEYEPPTRTIPLDSQVLLFHGDLGTGDRINSARQWRSIETSPRDRLQFAVFIMGLFHTKMACTETIWRTFLKDPKARSQAEKTSFYSDFKILRPRDSSALSTSFKFRPIHDAVRHIGICRRLDCLRVLAKEDHHSSLQAFADSEPEWGRVQELAQMAVQRFIPFPDELKSKDNKEPKERDEELENSMGFNIYSTLYEEISYAMDHGDIGRVELCLIDWAPLFEAAGKKKYAHHTIKLVHDLNHVFPPRMR